MKKPLQTKILRWANAGMAGCLSFWITASLVLLIIPSSMVARAAGLTVEYDLPSMVFPILVGLFAILPIASLVAWRWFVWTSKRSAAFNIGAFVILLGGAVIMAVIFAKQPHPDSNQAEHSMRAITRPA